MAVLPREKYVSYTGILLSSVLFGTYGMWSFLMGDSFGIFYQAWVRSLIIIALLVPFMLLGKSFRRIDREDWRYFAVFIGFCVCTQVPFYYAANNAPIGAVQLIFYALFLLATCIIGKFYLSEQITKVKLIAVFLALVGLTVIFGAFIALAAAPFALLLAGLNGAACGGESATSKRLTHKYSPLLVIFWGWVFTFLTHLPISLLLQEPQIVPAFTMAWLWLFLYAAISALAFSMSIAAFRYVDASIGGLIGLSEVIASIILGVLVFQQSLTLSVCIGGLLIIIASGLPDCMEIFRRERDRLRAPLIRAAMTLRD